MIYITILMPHPVSVQIHLYCSCILKMLKFIHDVFGPAVPLLNVVFQKSKAQNKVFFSFSVFFKMASD